MDRTSNCRHDGVVVRIGTRQLVFDVTVAAILALIILFLLMPATAHAQSNHHNSGGDDLNLSNEVSTATSIATGDTRSIALAGGNLGDVDIFGCLASTQYSVFIFWARQGIKIDALCVADRYDRAGKHDLAAQLRCQVPLISGLDYGGTTCIAANTFETPQDVPDSPESTDLCDGCDQSTTAVAAVNDERDERQYDIAQVMARQDALEAKIADEASTRRRIVNEANKRRAEDATYAQELIQKIQAVDQEHE